MEKKRIRVSAAQVVDPGGDKPMQLYPVVESSAGFTVQSSRKYSGKSEEGTP